MAQTIRMDAHERNAMARTFNPKYTTYTGDGTGRDGYVVFGNGGLHRDQRTYNQPFRQGFTTSPHMGRPSVTPKKEATAFDYVPDGSGRDVYIIKNYGLKSNYRSKYREFEKGLRSGSPTPTMDARALRSRDPWGSDATHYLNWPSNQAIRENHKIFGEQRRSIERLHGSPLRNSRDASPMDSIDNFEQASRASKTPMRNPDCGLGSRNKQNFFEKRGGSVTVSHQKYRPHPLKAYPSPEREADRFYKTFQRKFESKRVSSYETTNEQLKMLGQGQAKVRLNPTLEPIVTRQQQQKGNMMLRQVYGNRLGTSNLKGRAKHTPVNPYQNIDVVDRRIMPNTVMNSREGLGTAHRHPHPPVTAAKNTRSRTMLLDGKPQNDGKSGGISQMATTAHDVDFKSSGGRVTADVRRIIESKEMVNQTLTPALFAKKNQNVTAVNIHETKAHGETDPKAFQKRSASVYSQPRGIADTFSN